VDGGASINILTPVVCTKMYVSKTGLLPTHPFHGVLFEQCQPLGCDDILVTFGTEDNFRIEAITFDVADIDVSYDAIVGRPMISMFMVFRTMCISCSTCQSRMGHFDEGRTYACPSMC
jgi:hypothetical protein